VVVLINCDTIHVIYRDTGLVETVLDSLSWKTRPVLDATEPLLLSCCDKETVTHKTGRGVPMKTVQAKDDHARIPSFAAKAAMHSETTTFSRLSTRKCLIGAIY
jgi:hypothetical protein